MTHPAPRLRRWLTRLPGARRREARKSFHATAAERLVATGIPTTDGARVWVRSDRPGPHTVVLTTPDGESRTVPFDVPLDPAIDGTAAVFVAAPANAACRYTVIAADGTPIGEGRFRTPPIDPADGPDRFAIAIASCHQPFDVDGALVPTASAFLDPLVDTLEELGVVGLLLLGDQMYTDLPRHHSLFTHRGFARVAPPNRRRITDCTREEVRALFQRRYRAFWKVAGLQRLMARFPTLCIHDDHELVDNWGDHPDHGTPAWAPFREGALDACHDYQLLRMHPRPRGLASPTRFAWGPVAGLVLDLRSERRVMSPERIRLMGEAQWALLERFLEEEAARPVLVLGLSVPLLHVPAWLVEAGATIAPWGSGIHDRWSHPAVQPDRDRLVRTLAAHRRRWPDQQVVLVSGDVHVGVVTELHLGDAPPILQVVSSALTNLEREPIRHGSGAMPDLGPCFDTADGLACEARLLPGVDGAEANPWPYLNAGILDLERRDGRWTVSVRLLAPAEDDGPVRVVYRSR